MKRIVSVLILVAIAVTPVLAIDISVGASLGLGLPFLRGSDYEEAQKTLDAFVDAGGSLDESKLAFAPQIDAVISMIPFLSLETGVGFLSSKETQSVSVMGATVDTEFMRSEIVIPTMIRCSYEYPMQLGMATAGVTYLSVGTKLGIPLGSYMTSKADLPAVGIDQEIDAAPVVLDLAVAVGQEFKLGEKNYLGIRVGYDFNLLAPYDEEDPEAVSSDLSDLRHDNLLFGLTYRYMF